MEANYTPADLKEASGIIRTLRQSISALPGCSLPRSYVITRLWEAEMWANEAFNAETPIADEQPPECISAAEAAVLPSTE